MEEVNEIDYLEQRDAKPWFVTKKGVVGVTTIGFINFLIYLGFKNARINGVREVVQIKSNVVKVVDSLFLIQSALNWLDKHFGDYVEEKVNKIDIHRVWINRTRIIYLIE